MNRLRANDWLFWGSVFACYLLQLMPLPQALLPFKPWWLALVLVYWTLEAPEHVSLGRAFVLGLIGDVFVGDMLGEQALRLCIFCFILMRFRARLRFFPMWQQALAVLALLVNDRIVLLAERAAAGLGGAPPSYWLAPLVGALAWPWVFLLLDDARARLRARES
ncbi:MAG TPA: rod shape-determining protein MreD [Rudaea sp.]|jgi:rod shape-determining protein MreD|nr:rod shape-determining protein MreD [Rudaea sp.]